MQTILTVLSILLGVANLIQFLTSIATGSTLKARAQADFNNWYRVAEIADIIHKDPSRASELIRNVNGIADAARNEIKAYSKEKLGFEPYFDPASTSGPNPPRQPKWWEPFKLAFVPK
jgi:hypothetical protein